MDASTIAIIGLALTVVGLIATHFRTKSVSDLDNRVVKLEARFEAYLDFQERYNARLAHQDDDPEKIDRLLEKRAELEPIAQRDEVKLNEALERMIDDPKLSIGRRAAAAAVLSARKARDVEP